jgi:aryl-alcohol dehydrogenase-like predicted oxidoreductase
VSASGSTATSILTRESGNSVTFVFIGASLEARPRTSSLYAWAPMQPARSAIGTWSGGRFMHFGEPLADERLEVLLRPGDGIDTVITADVYGEGAADELLGRALAGVDRETYRLIGAVGHDFVAGERDGPRGFPRFTDPRLRGPDEYAGYLRGAAEASLQRIGAERLDLLLLHNPDRTGFTSEAVWDGMAALREAGITAAIGVAPGPANGFALDLIDCFERFGERIDWAMVILNPLEPWPGELCLDAAVEHDVRVLTRVVDYGGLFWDDVRPGHEFAQHDHRRFRPAGWVEAGRERLERMRPIAERHRLTPMQLACHWNLAHPAVACVAPTLIQETGPVARAIEDKRAELASLPDEDLSDAEVAEIRSLGDNRGSMALKGASPEHEGAERPDRWPLSDELAALAERRGIDPDRDLRRLDVAPAA